MKHTLQLGLRQQLAMTPQLQQAIRLLQLSTLELQTEVQDVLDSNYMLEMAEEGDEGSVNGTNGSGSEQHEPVPAVTPEQPEVDVQPVDIPKELAVDSAWEDIYDGPPTSFQSGGSGGSEGHGSDFEAQSRSVDSLRDHLIEQLELTDFSPVDRVIAQILVDGIDDDGYLTLPLEEVRDMVVETGHAALSEVDLPEIEAVLRRIQNFDPTGVGARNLGECLLLQLNQMPEDIRYRDCAMTLVRECLGLLESRDFNRLQRHLGVKEEELKCIIDFIRTLNPRPGTAVSSELIEYVIPDVLVTKRKEGWHVELNPDAMPRLRINPLYASFVRRGDDSADNESLRKHLNEARWFIKSLRSRSETLLKVATCIVERQQAFLDYGAEAMKPMVLHDIAEAVGMHESTISRVTTNKYMHTPGGVFELKYFFSSQVNTQGGGAASSTAIKALIKKLIAEENPRKPLSDHKLAGLLEETGVNVARRTVAKYRESMLIASSSERKRLD